jgi:hypothetical protein
MSQETARFEHLQDLQRQVREIVKPPGWRQAIPRIHIYAIDPGDGHYVVSAEKKANSLESVEGLKRAFCALQKLAGIAAGAPEDSDPIDYWIRLIASREDEDGLLRKFTHHPDQKPPIVQLLPEKTDLLLTELMAGPVELVATQNSDTETPSHEILPPPRVFRPSKQPA